MAVADFTTRLAPLFPSRAPAVPPVIGDVKSSEVTAVQLAPLLGSALVMAEFDIRYQNVTVCAAAALFRHCSPVYATVKFVIVTAELFRSTTPLA